MSRGIFVPVIVLSMSHHGVALIPHHEKVIGFSLHACVLTNVAYDILHEQNAIFIFDIHLCCSNATTCHLARLT